MIQSIRHKGLRAFFQTGSTAGIRATHAERLRVQLTALNTAVVVEDMDLPGFKLHRLTDKQKVRWSIWVNGGWRLTFEFRDGHVYLLDYENYH